MEDHVLKHAVEDGENLDVICERLPGRTRTAIQRRISYKDLTPKKEPVQMNGFSGTKTIERLESELKLRKAEAERDAAQQRYNIFAEQCCNEFTRVMKNDPTIKMADLFKQYAADFSKLNASISLANRRLLEAKIEIGL
jgi:hypothetical protein